MRSRIIPNTDTFYETDYLITFLFYDVIFAHYFFFNTDGLFTTAFLNFPQPSDLLDMWSSEESLPQLSQHILSTLQKLLFTVVLKFWKFWKIYQHFSINPFNLEILCLGFSVTCCTWTVAGIVYSSQPYCYFNPVRIWFNFLFTLNIFNTLFQCF